MTDNQLQRILQGMEEIYREIYSKTKMETKQDEAAPHFIIQDIYKKDVSYQVKRNCIEEMIINREKKEAYIITKNSVYKVIDVEFPTNDLVLKGFRADNISNQFI